MMKRVLFVYLIKELLLYFFISFLFFFMIFFVNQILLMAEDILKKHVPVSDVLLLVFYSLPAVVATAAPFATLVGFLMAIGRMVSDNEILALRALGVSFKVLLVPVLVAGLLVSAVSFFVNDFLLPLGTLEFNKLYQHIVLSDPGMELEPDSIRRNENSVFVTGGISENRVSDVLFFDTDSEGNQRLIVAGESVVFDGTAPQVVMQLEMQDALISVFDRQNPRTFDYMKTAKTVMNVFSSNFFGTQYESVNPREMTSHDLRKEIDTMRLGMTESDKFKINAYELEYYKKFSIPFGSLFFAFLALPLAVIFGRHNGQTVGLIVGLGISVLYWAMLIGGQTFGYRSGFSGFWSMWLPNAVIGAAGVFFFVRLIRR